jgi:hypothetical protein
LPDGAAAGISVAIALPVAGVIGVVLGVIGTRMWSKRSRTEKFSSPEGTSLTERNEAYDGAGLNNEAQNETKCHDDAGDKGD